MIALLLQVDWQLTAPCETLSANSNCRKRTGGILPHFIRSQPEGAAYLFPSNTHAQDLAIGGRGVAKCLELPIGIAPITRTIFANTVFLTRARYWPRVSNHLGESPGRR